MGNILYYLSIILPVYSFGTASPSFGPGMTVMLLVPGPTLTACDAFGAKVFPATRTLRSPTLPSSHCLAQMIIPIPAVLFMKLSSTAPPIDLKCTAPHEEKVLPRTTAPPELSLSILMKARDRTSSEISS